jgi:hypothetical protein
MLGGLPGQYSEQVEPPPPEALVLRFPPGGPDEVSKIRKEAKYVHRHHQQRRAEAWYRLSVWADRPRPGETREQTMTRLIHAAGLANVRVDDAQNSVFWWTTVGELTSRGFVLRKDGDPDERPEHYSVDLGPDEPSREVIELFVGAFKGPEQTGLMR